jgi:hypothetical protein
MSQKVSFEKWMQLVDAYCQQNYYVSCHDLVDVAYRDMYDDGRSPQSAAKKAYKASSEE